MKHEMFTNSFRRLSNVSKQLFALLSTIIFSFQIQAQCISDMPVDTFVCPSAQTQYVVPGNPTLIGGTAPFTYVWTMDTSTLSFNYPIYASDVLNDTTIINPIISNDLFQANFWFGGSVVSEPLTFYLEITDANGLSCVDSFEYFMVLIPLIGIMENWVFGDYVGDTVSLNPNYWVDGFAHPVTADWTPSANLLYADSVYPLTSTPGSYYVIITDALGCEYSGYCEAIYDQTSINEKSQNKTLLKITDVLGRKSKGTKNTPLFYIYDDGTVEKKLMIE
jgi:hypothetical protein